MTHMLWTANVINDKEAKDSFETYLQHNQELLTRLREIVEDRESYLEAKEMSLDSYESAGWSHKQAHINGQKAAYALIKQLTVVS